jgi:hypothetical protein
MPAAVQYYTDAISGALHVEKLENMLAALYRNRSSANFALKKFDDSMKDGITSLKFDPSNPKVIFHCTSKKIDSAVLNAC